MKTKVSLMLLCVLGVVLYLFAQPVATDHPYLFQRVVFLGRSIPDTTLQAQQDKGLVIRAYAGQTTNLFEMQNVNGTVLGGFNVAGQLVLGSDGDLQGTKLTTITATNVKKLRETGTEIVAAPGAGKILEFVSAVLFLDYTAPVYTETNDNLAIRYSWASGTLASNPCEMTGFIDQSADTMTTCYPKADPIVAATAGVNFPLILHNEGDGEFGAGNSVLRVRTTYRVHPTGF